MFGIQPLAHLCRMRRSTLFLLTITIVLVACGPGTVAEPVHEGLSLDTLTFRPELDSAKRLADRGAMDEATVLARSVLARTEGVPSQWKQHASALAQIGVIHLRRSEPDSALGYFHKGMALAELKGDTVLLGTMWLNMGTAHEQSGRYLEALNAALSALAIKEALGDQRGESRVLNNISMLYWHMDRLPESISTMQRSIMLKRTSDSLTLASSLNGLAVLLTEQQRYDTAIAVLHESLQWQDRLKSGIGRHIQHSNLGLAFEQGGVPDSALYYYGLSLDEARRVGDLDAEVHALYGIGEVLIGQGRFKEAAPFMDSSLVIARRNDSLEDIKEAHLSIARQREGVGDAQAALFHMKRYYELRDSLLDSEKDDKMNELLVRYGVERQERDNDRLRLDKERADLRAERQQWIAIGIGVLALTLVALGWAIIQRNRSRALQREADLEQQALRLQMDPHFLFNALNTIPGLYAGGDPAAANDHVGHLSKFLRLVLETSRRRSIPLAQEIELVEHYLRISANRRPGSFTWEVKVMPYVGTERLAVPPMLIQPVVENALEHGLSSATSGHLSVLVDLAGSVLHIEVRDNGIGRKAAATRPSRRNGRSLGIDLVLQRILLFDRHARPGDAVLVQDHLHPDGTAGGTTVTLRFRPQALTEHAAPGDRG